MNRLRIRNRQRRFQIDRAALLRLGRALMACAARAAPHRVWREIDILVVDDAGIAPINAATMGHEGSTDVLTLTYDSIPGEPEGATAELIVNAERAWQLGRGCRTAASRELALYLAHAFDHLCGHDDQTPADRRSMRRREWRWLRQTGIPEIFLP